MGASNSIKKNCLLYDIGCTKSKQRPVLSFAGHERESSFNILSPAPQMIIPAFDAFCENIAAIYEKCKELDRDAFISPASHLNLRFNVAICRNC